MTVQTAPAHRDAGPNELAAAKRAARWASTLEGRVLAAVVEAGDHGLTADEARQALGLPAERHYSVAPRLSALKRKGLVVATTTVRDRFSVYLCTPAGRAVTGRLS